MEDHFDISFELEHSLAQRHTNPRSFKTAQQIAPHGACQHGAAKGAIGAWPRGFDGKKIGRR